MLFNLLKFIVLLAILVLGALSFVHLVHALAELIFDEEEE